LLGPFFNERHFPGRGLLWEFIDINIWNITKNLVKHLDYKNDYRESYNDVAVYSESFVVETIFLEWHTYLHPEWAVEVLMIVLDILQQR
jgi:hypothetical protein